MTISHQQVLDAIHHVDLHHVHGTNMVACFLVRSNGPVVLGFSFQELAEPDIANAAARARAEAEKQLAQNLEQEQLDAQPKETADEH